MRKIIQGLCAAIATLVAAVGLSVALPTTAQAAPTCNSFTSVLSHHDTHGTIFAHVPSVGSGSWQFDCVLGQGNQGIAVLVLQEALYSCYGQGISRDGVFGPNTRQAVINAQRAINRRYGTVVAVDGVYGPQTRRWIDFAIFDHGNGGRLIYGLCQRVTV